jgi:hypothetical protein
MVYPQWRPACPERKRISGRGNLKRCMGRAIFVSLFFRRKPCKFIEIPISGFAKSSHALRQRFIAAKMRELKQFVSAVGRRKGAKELFTLSPLFTVKV